VAKRPEITIERDGKNFVIQCGDCSHKVIKGDKLLGIQIMWGHMVGRHRYPINDHFDGIVHDNS
jgi:hypothetical protein